MSETTQEATGYVVTMWDSKDKGLCIAVWMLIIFGLAFPYTVSAKPS